MLLTKIKEALNSLYEDIQVEPEVAAVDQGVETVR